jgi:hypothetical protein
VPLSEVDDTGAWEVVYNLRVADYRTYFVGDDTWSFAAWAHNAYTLVQELTTGRIFRFTATNYDAQWFIPRKREYMNSNRPSQMVIDAVNQDVQLNWEINFKI